MNRRIISFTLLICLVIIVACAISAILYNSNKTMPAIRTQESIKNQKYATETASIIAATIAFEQTQVAIPTNTSSPSPTALPTNPPEQINCSATIQGSTRKIYPVPGQGYSLFFRTLEPGTKVTILGRLADRGWQKIKSDDLEGWIRDDGLSIVGDCQPTIYDLHYLQNWVETPDQLVMEDTFSFGDPWTDSNGSALFIKSAPDGEAYLEVLATKPLLFFPKAQQIANLSAFKIYTSITTDQIKPTTIIGLRFRESNDYYYQVDLFPNDCHLEIYDSNTLVYSNTFSRIICIGRYYDISITLSENNKFEMQVNGSDPINVNLQDPDGHHTLGDIKLFAQDTGVQLHYFIVTAPK